jgi:hypothetical protein
MIKNNYLLTGEPEEVPEIAASPSEPAVVSEAGAEPPVGEEDRSSVEGPGSDEGVGLALAGVQRFQVKRLFGIIVKQRQGLVLNFQKQFLV